MNEHAGANAEREAIRHLMARYTIAGDRGQTEELAAVFTPDGILHFNAETSQGREEIARRLSRSPPHPRLLVTRHHLTTSRIELLGETAKGRTYFQVLTNIGLDHHGVYQDRFVKIGEEWLISHREVRIDWQAEGSLFPPLHVRGIAPA
ncbi:hypothetical protein GGQ88_002201 [Novosphingobium hassiacum]|uniref:SnoaL-like domain-containing protein n=1 Tax=Novosphingobium hassiacum TaxID=173676 RepID=A0A7W5ZZ36_9SPHN|nr:nuclear transport factor 2 family protein [Novosphingobium hassiacum]MBB3860932.1 hypothetical protein [Novosphingobium hassiacum]